MMTSWGWGTFLFWGVMDFIIAILAFFFLRETKGMSLESIAHTRYKKGATSNDGISVSHKDNADGDAPHA